MVSGVVAESSDISVSKIVDTRFYKYLVSRKFAIKDDELVDGLFDEDKRVVEQEEASNHGRFNRKMLDVELNAQAKRDEKKRQSVEFVKLVSKSLKPHYLQDMRVKLEDIDYVTSSLIQLPQHIHDILEVTYSPSATIKSISGVVGADNSLTRKILQTVNNHNFRKSIGRSDDARKIDKLPSAIGYMGLDGFQALLPFLMFKNTIKPYCQLFTGMYEKIWKHCVGSAICANFLMNEKQSSAKTVKERNRIDPFEGYVMSFMANVGIIAIYHQYFETFEQVRLKKLEESVQKKRFDIYDAIFSSAPSEAVMAEILEEFSSKLPSLIFESLGWKVFPRSLRAINEEAEALPIEDRSLYGRILKQSIQYSKFELLRRAKFFSKDHLESFLIDAGLEKGEMSKLVQQNLRQLDLKKYVA